MFTDLIREHARRVAEVQALEERLNRERTAALAALPSSFGFPDLASFIRAVKDAVGPARKPRQARTPAKRKQKPRAAPTPPPSPQPAYPGVAAAKAGEPEKAPLPTGTSLDDPKNFGQLPDVSLLERGTKSRESFIDALAEALRFAQKVLHTSKVPAKVWWEWRQFERSATDAIHAAKAEGLPSASE